MNRDMVLVGLSLLFVHVLFMGCDRTPASEPLERTPEYFVFVAPSSGVDIRDEEGRTVGRFRGAELAWRDLLSRTEDGSYEIFVSHRVEGRVLVDELEFCPRTFDSGALETRLRSDGAVEAFSLKRDPHGVMTLKFSDSPYQTKTFQYECPEGAPLPVTK